MTACWNLDCVCVYFRLHQHYCFIRWKRLWCGQLRQEISCEKPQWSPETGTMLFIYIFVSTGIAFLRYENEIGLENLGINKSRKNMTVWNQDWVVCLSAMFREKSVTWCVLKMRCPTTFLKQTFDGTQISKLQVVGLQIKIEEIRIYFLWLLFYSS